MMLMKCNYPNCPVYRHVLLKDNEVAKRRETMTEDEYFGHLQAFHGEDSHTAREVIARAKDSPRFMP